VSDPLSPDISSHGNRWIKLARSLHRRRQRYRERAILVEGVRPVQEAIESATPTRAILLSVDLDPDDDAVQIAREAELRGVQVFTVEPLALQHAADTETPQGILAICEMPPTSYDAPVESQSPLLLIIDRVRDPGNLGTLVRSALGSGVDSVLIGPNSADPFGPKAIRAGAGAQFRLRIEFLSWDHLPSYLTSCRIYAAEAEADVDYVNIEWTLGTAIVVGNETEGISSDAFRRVHGIVGIPLANRLESLNAGVAGSVILFEAWRQRRRAQERLSAQTEHKHG
jgi:RNA methyltransferase, TrmH family